MLYYVAKVGCVRVHLAWLLANEWSSFVCDDLVLLGYIDTGLLDYIGKETKDWWMCSNGEKWVWQRS